MWTKEHTQRWRDKHASICVDCGKKCSPKAKRCDPCEAIRRRKYIPQFCIDCQKPINQNRQARQAKTIRCRSCMVKHRWVTSEMRAKIQNSWVEKSRGRIGKKYKTSGGYIRIFLPEHHKSDKKGYVLEHIVIWEQAHGKELPAGWIIHHLNGIKDDNRFINLVALPGRKHYLVLQAKAKRIQELEALLNGQGQLL